MGIYASRPARMVGQLLSDVFVLVWAVVWALVGMVVNGTIERLASPARDTARTAAKLAGNFTDAATQASQVPGLGDQLRRPFDAASTTMGTLIATANHQADIIERVALVAGWLAFLMPVSLVIALWLPRRIRFYRQAKASQQFLDSSVDLDLFALRAMAAQPLSVLAAISDDPVGAWRAGDREVINRLAEIELRRHGMQLPDALSPSATPN